MEECNESLGAEETNGGGGSSDDLSRRLHKTWDVNASSTSKGMKSRTCRQVQVDTGERQYFVGAPAITGKKHGGGRERRVTRNRKFLDERVDKEGLRKVTCR